MITFGGSDPRNLTAKTLKILSTLEINSKIIVILGMSFSHKNQIKKIVKEMQQKNYDIEIIYNSNMMAQLIAKANYVIAANGRTVFEVASLNIPLITISANAREETHSFTRRNKIGIHLGLYTKVTGSDVKKAIIKMEKLSHRREMEKNLKKFDLINGVNNVMKKINSRFEKWKGIQYEFSN